MTENDMRPLILVRGFGGVGVADEQSNAYQGFNNGTVYPGRRGENYIYEGFVLRALKSQAYPYRDATNVVGYYAKDVVGEPSPGEWYADLVDGTVVVAPGMARQILKEGVGGTVWIYRYYDLQPREIRRYGHGLAQLIRIIAGADGAAKKASGGSSTATPFRGVDIVAHSMGGLVTRAALQSMQSAFAAGSGSTAGSPRDLVHRIVFLGTPHRGIAFQRLPGWLVNALPGAKKAADELAAFDPRGDDFRKVKDYFDPPRLLCVVGTNYRTYGNRPSSLANRLSGLIDEEGALYNRSDGLVKQAAAQLPGAPRTFVHKCHGGEDSLVTSREAYEIAMRFFHGTHQVKLWLDNARVTRGKDRFGRSEFYFGVSIKPRFLDFELFHQSVEAENCYGPLRRAELDDQLPDLATELEKTLADAGDDTQGWAGADRLIWEGWIDASAKNGTDAVGMVFRLDVYVGERDTWGVGFSDNRVFSKQYYVQAVPGPSPALYIHTGEEFIGTNVSDALSPDQLAGRAVDGDASAAIQRAMPTANENEWTFQIAGTGFDASLRVSVTRDHGND